MIRFWNLQGSASCLCGVTGWLAAKAWFSGHSWTWLLVSFAVFLVGMVLSKRGIARGPGVVDRMMPTAGAALNMAGMLTLLLLPAILWSTLFGKDGTRRR